MSPLIITLVVLVLAIVAFISGKIPVAIVAIVVTLSLYVTGVITGEQALAGFGDPVIVFIAALFVVSEGLDATGVTTWAGQQLTRAGTGRRRMLVLVMLLVAVVSALISVNGAVAALVPMVVVLALRIRQPASQLLIPLAFGAHAGSLLVLTGSPVNVYINETISATGADPIPFFGFALLGLPLVAGTILIVVLAGHRLLPHRTPATTTLDLSNHAQTLAQQYSLDDADAVIGRDHGLVEVVVPPRSALLGETVFPGMVTASGELVIVAVQRGGEHITDRARLQVGDTMLLQGSWGALDANTADPEVLLVDSPQTIRRQAVPFGPRAGIAVAVLAAMVVLLATGVAPPALVALGAAAAMVLLRVLSPNSASRSISWTTIVLVGGMIPLSTAIQVSGAADLIAESIVTVTAGASPVVLLLALSLVTIVLGQLISNMATALILAPIAVAVAAETGVSPVPLLMAVAISAAAAFLTPVATPANTMVYGPGGYRFGDYWKLGVPLIVLFIAVSTLLVPLVWPF